jgi:hypothetical protein
LGQIRRSNGALSKTHFPHYPKRISRLMAGRDLSHFNSRLRFAGLHLL